MTFVERPGNMAAMDKQRPKQTQPNPVKTDEQWARDKLRWTIDNCVRALVAELKRNAAAIEKRAK